MIKLNKHTSSSSSICIINPNLFTFFFLFHQSFSIDSFYESCVPKDCGDGRNISYPFWITGLQDPNCGYPGFDLTCNYNGSAVIRISENNFTIKDIEYKDHTFRVQNSALDYCPSKITNFTFDPNRFTLHKNTSTTRLVLISNCSSNYTEDFDKYKIRSSCSNGTKFVMLESDENLRNVTRRCSNRSSSGGSEIVEMPVELRGGEGRSTVVDGGNYMEVVERGFVMGWLAADCGQCERSGGRCGFSMTAFEFRCFCVDRPKRVGCKPEVGRSLAWVIFPYALGAAAVTILIVIIVKFKFKTGWRKTTKCNVNLETFLKDHEFLAPKRYPYSQVQKMTNSFVVKLGQGGFGSVYKGSLSNGNLVAVKVLSEIKGNGEDFINVVASVGKTSHVNVVSLVGFCLEGHQRALIYEFMPNGSLEKFIYERTSSSCFHLGWKKLFEIAIGIARGLEYLHRGCNT